MFPSIPQSPSVTNLQFHLNMRKHRNSNWIVYPHGHLVWLTWSWGWLWYQPKNVLEIRIYHRLYHVFLLFTDMHAELHYILLRYLDSMKIIIYSCFVICIWYFYIVLCSLYILSNITLCSRMFQTFIAAQNQQYPLWPQLAIWCRFAALFLHQFMSYERILVSFSLAYSRVPNKRGILVGGALKRLRVISCWINSITWWLACWCHHLQTLKALLILQTLKSPICDFYMVLNIKSLIGLWPFPWK